MKGITNAMVYLLINDMTFRRYILWSVIYIFIAKAENISLKYLAVQEFVPWLLLGRRVITKYEIGLVDITILITTNVLTKRSTVCGLKTVHNCYTNVRHLYKKCGYMFKLIFVLELIINIISLWFMYELCKRIPQTTLSHFHSNNGITIRDAQPLEINACIGYKNVVHLDGGPHVVYFKSVKMVDILKTSKSYYTHSIKTMTVFDDISIVSSRDVFKKNMKFCKMTPGQAFHFYIKRHDMKDIKKLNFKWIFNGTEIGILWRTQKYRYKEWVDFENGIPTIHLIIRNTLKSDVGFYDVMITHSWERYQCSKPCFQNAILMNNKGVNCSSVFQTEQFKAGKFYIIDERIRENTNGKCNSQCTTWYCIEHKQRVTDFLLF